MGTSGLLAMLPTVPVVWRVEMATVGSVGSVGSVGELATRMGQPLGWYKKELEFILLRLFHFLKPISNTLSTFLTNL